MTEIEYLLREGIGLDAASIGSGAIQRIARLRMKSLGLKRPEQYKQVLQASPAEWTELVESVIVTETWFFRDQEPFAALVRLVQSEWLPNHPTGQLRLLSVPCSSGEEPYSLAMALLDAGVPADRFHVDAIDLSGRALAKARRAVYGRNSFRGKDLAFRDRWFQSSKEGFALAPAVRRCVHFTEQNLLHPSCLADQPPYDFVFCRNLLIYFDAVTRTKALDKLRGLLAPTGVLFVGAAEQPLVINHGFASANLALAFACRKAEAATPPARPGHPVRALRATPRVLATTPGPAARASSPAGERGNSPRVGPGRETRLEPAGENVRATGTRSTTAATPLAAGHVELEHARRLADAGQLQEAAAVCEAHLKQSRASAPAWYLLGLVREAAGDPSASDCYRKALYLEPNHYESLLQLALLAEKNGDAARARTYRRRAQRTQERAAPDAL